MISQLLKHRTAQIRGVVYLAVLIPLAISLLYDVIQNERFGRGTAFTTIVIILSAFLLEAFLFWRRRFRLSAEFFPSQIAVYSRLEKQLGLGIDKLIRESMRIDLLCDTLKTFSDDDARLKLLSQRVSEGARVRILVMDQLAGETLSAVAAGRSRVRGVPVFDEDLRQEIRSSLNRFERLMPPSSMRGATALIRRYTHFPTCSIYRFDDYFVVCSYTFGRGGSSPALIVKASEQTEEYCKSLERGFDEAWELATPNS